MAHVEAMGSERRRWGTAPATRPSTARLHGRRTYRGAPRGHHGPLGRGVDDETAGHRHDADRQRAEVDRRGAVREHVRRARRVGAPNELHDRSRHRGVGDDQQVDRAEARAAERLEDRRSPEGRPAARAAEHHHVDVVAVPTDHTGGDRVTERRGCMGGNDRGADRAERAPRRPGGGSRGATRPERRPRALLPAPRPAGGAARRAARGRCARRRAPASRGPAGSAGARAPPPMFPPRPATRPPVRPQTMTSPATGTQSRLAGNDATGTGPKVASSTGATPSCAARVTPAASRRAAGPGRIDASRGASTTMATAAQIESWNPVERTSKGSISTSAVTARPTTRNREIGAPGIASVAASAAIAEARSTDGSKRVITPKRPITMRVAPSRGQRRRRRSSGPASAKAKATFCPETASRCVSPAPLKASARSAGCSRSSPRTRPVKSDRARG